MATWKKVIISGSSISQLANDTLYIHTGSSGVALSGSFSGSYVGDGSGLTGVTAAGTLSSSAQIADDISGSLGVNATLIRSLTTEGISGSFTSTSSSIASDVAGLVSDSGSFSTRVADLEAFSSSLDDGYVTEAELVAATASLSASLATDIATNTAAIASANSGSFSGSFQGDGSQLTGLDIAQTATVLNTFSSQTSVAVTHNFGTKNVLATVYDSSDAQIIPASIVTTDDNTVTVTFDTATSGRVIVGKGGHIVSGSVPFENILNKPTLLSGSAQIADNISGSFTSTSASIATDISALESFSSSLSTTSLVLSGSFSGSFVGDGSQLSGVTSYTDSDTLAYINSVGVLSGSAQIADDISGSFASTSGSIASDIASLDSSKADKSAITGAFAAASGSFSTRVTSLESSVGAGGLLSSSAQIADDISGSFTSTSASLASDIADNLADLNAIHTYTSSLKTAITLAGANVTINGNLEVSGTQTIVDSTTVEIGDNILALNGTGATNGGIEVNDPNGPASGSLLWDGTNNYWKAGGQGSESKVLLATGDGILSGSAQIAANISGSFTSTSASIASDIASLDSTKADKSAISGAFVAASSSIATDIDNLQADSGSFSTRVSSLESSVGAGGLLSSSAQIADDISGSLGANATLIRSLTANTISGSFTSTSASIASDIATNVSNISTNTSGIADLVTDSGSFSTRVTDNESDISALQSFSSSLDATFASEAELNSATASLSSSLATDIATNVSNISTNTSDIADLVTDSGSFSTRITSNDSDIANLVTDSGSFSTRITSNDSDIADLVTDSGSFSTRVSDLEAFSSSLDSSFVTEAELVAATASLSSSLAADIATNVSNIADLVTDSGSFSTRITSNDSDIADLVTDSGSFSTRITTNEESIATLEGKTLVSSSVLAAVQQGEVKLTTNGVDGSTVDLGLQTTDSPTFAGLTVNGNLIVTGDTIEAQVTNLNVEDKYILLNSGSTSGDSGIIFGGANGAANTGVGLFWDSSYNSNDGRLAIVNTLAAGATSDQTPAYYVGGVFVGTDGDAQTAQADHPGNIRVDAGEIYIYI